jgi:hypothetical protein
MCPAMSSFCLITTFVKDAAITRKTARCWISTNVHNASCYLVAIEPPLEELYSLQVASCVQHLTVNTMLAHQYVTYLICWLKQLSYILFPMYNRWRPVFGTRDLNPTEGLLHITSILLHFHSSDHITSILLCFGFCEDFSTASDFMFLQ